MPTIKIYPPSQLPDRNVSETEFNIWKEELEVYLSQEESFQQFLEDGNYKAWKKQEEAINGNRITDLVNEEREANGEALAQDEIDRLLKQKKQGAENFSLHNRQMRVPGSLFLYCQALPGLSAHL